MGSVNRLALFGARLARRRTLAAGALAVVAALALHALFHGRLVDGHDSMGYPPRITEFQRALADGQIPPLWAADLGAGHGQPLFEFAPPLLYLAASPLRAAGCGIAVSIQIGLALLVAFGAIAVYRLARRGRASRIAALGAASVWLFAPYLSLDLFVRAAFSEAAAMAVAPIALLGLLRALDDPTASRILLAASGVALIVLGHNGVALLMLPALGLVVIGRRSGRCLLDGAAVLTLGLGLSTFVWLPALIEQRFVKTTVLREGFLLWSVHAISPIQLLRGKWLYGYSVAGPNDGMSFAIGLPLLLLAALGFLRTWRSKGPPERFEAVSFAVIALLGAWLATETSAVVWSHVETIRYLTHPWRTLLLPATFLPLLTAPAFDWLKSRARFLAPAAIAFVVLVNFGHTPAKGYISVNDVSFSPDSIARNGVNTSTYEEYEPRWVEHRPPYSAEPLHSSAGQRLDLRDVRLGSARQEMVTILESPTDVETAAFFYPGWTVAIDGHAASILPVPGRGTMTFPMPAGTHRVVLALRPTPLRRMANLLSIAALAGALLVVAMSRRRPGRRAPILAFAAFLLPCLGALFLVGNRATSALSAKFPGPAPSAEQTTSPDAAMEAGLNAFYGRRDAAAAIPWFRRALQLSPDHYGATFQLARALDESGRRDEALPLWERVLSLGAAVHDEPTLKIARARLAEPSPQTADSFVNAGLEALYSRNDPAAASAAFRKALAINPNHYGALYQLARALDREGRRGDARPFWERVARKAKEFHDAPTLEAARARLAASRP